MKKIIAEPIFYEDKVRIGKKITENIVNKIGIPIETKLNIKKDCTTYDCIIDSRYKQEIETLKQKFYQYNYPIISITRLPDNKIKITFKIL